MIEYPVRFRWHSLRSLWGRHSLGLFLSFVALVFHVQSASVLGNIGGPSIGILGGRGSLGQEERSFEILERKLQRWLEDSNQVRARVAQVQGTETEHRSQLELEKLQLQQLAAELVASATSKSEAARSSVLSSNVRALVEKLLPVQAYGPQLQLGLVALAIEALNENRREQARDWIAQARLLHPEAKLEAIFPLSWERHPRREAIEDFWADSGPATARSCRLKFDNRQPGETIFVNGFPIQSSEIHVVPGRSYSFSRRNALEELGAVHFACEGPGERVVTLTTDKVLAWGWDEARKFSLSKISQRHSVATLLVLDKRKDEYNIYLFTPGLGVDAVPTLRPLRVEDIQSPASLPIEWDQFQSLLEKHRRESAKLVSLDRFAPAAELNYQPEETPVAWYERTSTWVIAGAIATGITVAVLASRSGPKVQSQTGFVIPLK